MNALEWRAVAGLSLVYALRMIGMFMILPVLALHALTLPGPVPAWQIGLAIGIYGLMQALLQIPLGLLSDRIGRKPVILAGMLLFALGSFIAAAATDMPGIILGRAVQGLGAVSAAVAALLADVTRDSVRTRAMALMGAGMGAAFVLALVLGPVTAGLIGVPGIFMLTGVLALLSLPVVQWGVPDAPRLPPARGGLRASLMDVRLLRLDAGIFLLHAAMTALFVALPLALAETLSLPVAAHWRVYLPVLLLSLLPVFPLIVWSERQGHSAAVFAGAIVLIAAALALAGYGHTQAGVLLAALLLFFIGFNYLEGALPARISRQAPAAYKGAALGLYSTAQFLGGFAGALFGGLALERGGIGAAFAVAACLPAIWFIVAFKAEPAPAALPSNSEQGEPHGTRRQ